VVQWLQIDDWEFNIFELDKLTQGRALYTVCMTLMENEGLLVRHGKLLLLLLPSLQLAWLQIHCHHDRYGLRWF